MLRYRITLITLILFTILGYTISSSAEDDIEDLIDIAISKNKVIAVIKGENNTR